MTSKLNTDNKVVGIKQVRRALDNSEIDTIYIAGDADDCIISPIVKQCSNKGIDIVEVKNMEELGDACGIDINAAIAALLK